MPAISSDEGIVQAARDAIDILLQFKGFPVVLVRQGPPIAKPGGGHDAGDPFELDEQIFAWSQVGDDIVEDTDAGDSQVIKREYVLTGKWDADIRINDTWEDDIAEYLVESTDNENGFKTVCNVVGFVKMPT